MGGVELDELANIECLLLTQGDASPAWFSPMPSWPARSTAPRFTRTEAPDTPPLDHLDGHGLPLAFARARRRAGVAGQRRHR